MTWGAPWPDLGCSNDDLGSQLSKRPGMILQASIPYNPLQAQLLPGIKPLELADWLRPDEACNEQLTYRSALLGEKGDKVLRMDPGAQPAAQELLEVVLDHRYGAARDHVIRPDGARVTIDWQKPLATLGQICQEDFCILERREGCAEHVLTGAVLCFPASWTLAEKFMRPLIGIHDTVDSYDDSMARRVQRLFDGVQVGRPLWRFNALWYHSPELYAPRSVHDPRDQSHGEDAPYLRSEKQVILRLPNSRSVVFSIHTYMMHRDDVMAQWGGQARSR